MLEEDSNYEPDYPEPQSELLLGIVTEGIITFPPLDPEVKQARLYFEGSSDNWDLDIETFIFVLSWE